MSCIILTASHSLVGAHKPVDACTEAYFPHKNTASHIDAQKYPAFALFVAQHALPEDYRNAVDHFRKSREGRPFFTSNTPWKMKDSSLYFKGNDLSRIFNACRMKKCIDIHSLNHLEVATKYVEKAGSEWKIFAQAVAGKPVHDGVFSKPLVEQLITLGQKTGFSDWGANWVWKEEQNTLVCIDTEDLSFSFYPLESLSALKKSWGKYFTPHSLSLLDEKIKAAQQNPHQTVTLSHYDGPDSNFKQVERESAELQQETARLA